MQKQADSDDERAGQAVLAFLRRPDYRPVSQRELLHRMHVPPDRYARVRTVIGDLLDSGQIVKTTRGRLAAVRADTAVEGKLHRHPAGYGFVVPTAGGEDVFIAARDLRDEITGDTVVARITRRGRAGRSQGVIERTVERRHRRIVGVFLDHGGQGRVVAFDAGFGSTIEVPASFQMDARHEDVVEVELLNRGGGSSRIEGKVLEVVGHLDDPGTDIEVVSRRYGLAGAMSESVEAAADLLPRRIGPREKRGRVRFDDPAPVTIDGETARDFDDAFSVENTKGDGFKLKIHIADVSHFVKPGSVLDLEARQRGTSVYFPGTVLPMLPSRISDDLCSLRPGVDRLVQTAILEIDASGDTRNVSFADGVIRSAARLTYRQVGELLSEHSGTGGVPARVIPMLERADALRRLLARKRRSRGGIDVDLPEPQLLLDVEGVVTGIHIEPRNAAHLMIEEFMIAANEAVASFLERRKRPCMFRVHDTPDPLKLELLAEFAASLGYEVEAGSGGLDGAGIGRLLDRVEGKPEQAVLTQVVLRSMQQAKYTMNNEGHFGLGASSYCHFTSPIRRYPDLLIHRLVRAARGLEEFPGPDEPDLEETAGQLSTLERSAEAAEREVLAWKKLRLVQGREGEEFDGVVTGVAKFGLFIQLTENLVEGLVRVERLGDDRFDFDESRMELRGRHSGRAFRLGARLRVRLERIDRVLRRVDFEFLGRVESGAKKAGSRKSGSRDRRIRDSVARKTPAGARSRRRSQGRR